MSGPYTKHYPGGIVWKRAGSRSWRSDCGTWSVIGEPGSSGSWALFRDAKLVRERPFAKLREAQTYAGGLA